MTPDDKASQLAREIAAHYIIQIHCDHDKRTDQALCYCGWRGKEYQSVGQAVASWSRHVAALLCPHLGERWIPVEETLPELNVIVLVANNSWKAPFPKVMKGHLDLDGRWCGHYANTHHCGAETQKGLPTSDPTHWRPLPSPPESGKEGECAP